MLSLIYMAEATQETTIVVDPSNTAVKGPKVFGSIMEARDAIRLGLGQGTQRTVYLRGGYHFLDQPFTLDARDTATADAPTIYTSYPGEQAHLSGGKRIPTSMLRAVALKHAPTGVYSVNLFMPEIGLNASILGQITNPYPKDMLELFYDGKPATLARDPNIGDDKYETWYWSGYENITSVSGDGLSFNFNDSSAAERWGSALDGGADLWLHGYFKFDWRDTYVKIDSIKKETSSYTVTRSNSTAPAYPWVKGCRFYALNALELLDKPGEYYLNRTSGDLFFWPPSPLTYESDVIVSVLPNVIESTGAAHTTFENLTLSVSRGSTVSLSGDGYVLRNCTISNGGGDCALVSGQQNQVEANTVFGCGAMGISMTTGSVHTLAHGNSSAVGNVVSDYARLIRTYQAAIHFDSVGLLVSHNTLSNGPHTAIQGGGNDNIFEYNSISHVSYECTDTGAFYVGRSWAQRGNIARYNTFDTIRPTERLAQKSCSQNAFYLDDQMSGWSFYGNTIRNCTTGVLLGGGRDNQIYDNYFEDNDIDIYFDDRGLTWQAKSCTVDCNASLGTSCFHAILESLNYTQPPYSTHYPELVHIYDPLEHPCTPVNNTIKGNRWCHTHSTAGGEFITANQTKIDSWFSVMTNNSEHCN